MTDYPTFQTLLFERKDGVAWVTLNRPQAHNAFDAAMRLELRDVWRRLRGDDEVRAIVLMGAGEKAFCSGIDRNETFGGADEAAPVGHVGGEFQFTDVGDYICPKQCDLWKPVIAAVNGMACGGAFYLLGECDVIIAAEDATFFDPHVTYGMAAVYEPTHLLQRMPLGEVLRLSLLGSSERMSAERAFQVGLVSEVTPADELAERAGWVARTIAESPALAVQATLRAIWAAHDMGRREAFAQAPTYVGLGTDEDSLKEGQARFASGKRVDWRVR